MKVTRFIGSMPARVASALLAVSAVVAWWGYARVDKVEEFWLYAGIATTALAFVSSVHYSRRIYNAWLKVAHRLQMLIVTVLFSMCYLVLVPPLYLFARAADSLKLRSSNGVDSYWIDRRDEERTLRFYERMG